MIFTIGQKLRDGEQPVGDALHRGDDHDDLRATATGFTRPAACNMRSAPSSDVPPNLNATTFRRDGACASSADVRCVIDTNVGRSSPKRNVSHRSAGTSAWTFLGLMASAPGFRWSDSGGGLKEETHRQFASGGGLETFSGLLAVSPRAGSGNVDFVVVEIIDSDDRRGGNSLRGDGKKCHGPSKVNKRT